MLLLKLFFIKRHIETHWFEKKESGPVQKPPFTWHLNISLSRPSGGAQRPSSRRPGQTGAKYSQDRLSKLRPWIGWPPWQRTEFQGQVFAKDLNRMQTPKENVHSLWNFITAAPLLLHADVLRLRKYNCTSIFMSNDLPAHVSHGCHTYIGLQRALHPFHKLAHWYL